MVWAVVGKPQLWIGSMWLTSGSAYSVKEGAFVTARHVATKLNFGAQNAPLTHS